MLPLILALLVLVHAQHRGEHDDIDNYDFGGRSSHYVAPAVKELVMETPRCLPPEAIAQMSSWLQRMNEMTQYRMLYAVGVQRLIRVMEAGQSLCSAMREALPRMYRKHTLSLAQRASLDISLEWGDGWQETAEQMRAALGSMPHALFDNIE